jgi:hypothetical protein
VTKIELLSFIEYKYIFNKELHTPQFLFHRILNPMQQKPSFLGQKSILANLYNYAVFVHLW